MSDQEPKRINEGFSTTLVPTNQLNARFGPASEVRRSVNYHNIWWGMSVEPENADANATGRWILWIKKDATAADPTFSGANINAETFNQRIIACGVWAASNQSPYTMPAQHMNSSRTLLVGEELVITLQIQGISAGEITAHVILCAGQTGK